MKTLFLREVEFGILNDNGEFVFTPIIHNMPIYFKGESAKTREIFFKLKVKDYLVSERSDELIIEIYDMEDRKFIVKSFSKQYMESLILNENNGQYKETELVLKYF